MEPECPHCGSFNTLTVSQVAASQTFTGNAQGGLLGGGTGGFNIGLVQAGLQFSSELARQLAPPAQPERYHPDASREVLALVAVSVLLAFPASWGCLLGETYGYVLLILCAAIWLAAWIRSFSSRAEELHADGEHARAIQQWHSQMALWQRSRLCAQCGAVFVPTLPPAAGTTPLPAAPGQQIAPRRP